MQREFETLEVKIAGNLAEICLNRPDSLNSFDHMMHEELIDAFLWVRAQTQIRAILFRAQGRVFSAGGDFDLMLQDRNGAKTKREMADNGRALFLALAECHIPIVTALQGDVVGLGATLVLCSDAIVACGKARISDPHVVVGLVAGDGGVVVWPQTVGMLRAKRYLLTGDRITAADAYDFGMVTDLVDDVDQVEGAARALATRIAALPPLAVQNTKHALNKVMRHRFDEVFDMAMNDEMDCLFSDDLLEAIRALKEKRTGRFTGR